MRSDGEMMVQSGQKTTLAKVETVLQLFLARTESSDSVRISKSLIQPDMLRVGEVFFESLCGILDELLWKCFGNALKMLQQQKM